MVIIKAYEDNSDNCEDHNCFALLFSCKSLVTADSRFENVCLLLFEIQKILELKQMTS